MQMLHRIAVSRRLGALVGLAALLLLILAIYFSHSERRMLIAERQNAVRQTVETASGIVQHYHALAQQGAMSTAQAQRQALQLLKALRYGGQEYFWVNDMHPRMVMHPMQPQLDGQDLSGHHDPAGNALFLDFVRIVRTAGAGYHQYLWPMPGRTEPVEKVSYVMGFEPWGWVIGSGVYIDNVHAAFMQRIQWAMVCVLGATALLLGIGVLIARSIVQQLGTEPEQLLALTRHMAQGDLSRKLQVRGASSSVLQGLEQMRANVSQIVQDVRHGAERVALASREIAQGNQDLSVRTEQQAGTLQQTAGTMEQCGHAASQNADRAQQARQLAGQSCQVAEHGGNVVQEVVNTMRGIRSASQRMADILSTIDGIAFQTNILALNAAVEAARAGEQGRGFAVVASEVRNLAQRCASAAKEIKGLIADNLARVEQGSDLADRAGITMNDVVQAIRQVNTIVAHISADSAAQSHDLALVTQSVTQMDHCTQQNAALVEQGAAAARSLQEQAQQLLQAVARFRLDEGAALPQQMHLPPACTGHTAMSLLSAA